VFEKSVSDKRSRERSRFAKFAITVSLAKVVLLESVYMNIIPNELKRNANFILPSNTKNLRIFTGQTTA